MKSKELAKAALAVGFVALAVGSGKMYASAVCTSGEVAQLWHNVAVQLTTSATDRVGSVEHSTSRVLD